MIKSITNFLIIFFIFQQLKSQISQIDQNGYNAFCDETLHIEQLNFKFPMFSFMHCLHWIFPGGFIFTNYHEIFHLLICLYKVNETQQKLWKWTLVNYPSFRKILKISVCKIHWASKETYHFFRVTLTSKRRKYGLITTCQFSKIAETAHRASSTEAAYS